MTIAGARSIASESTPPAMTDTTYRVLARKYRPMRLAELIGQEGLVRTLSNAFDSGRLAHGYMLTGVRGVGKTTTARIIARALNCVGEDGGGGLTANPCGRCEPCRAIAEDRHIDVLEIDAASHTGVDHMRELIDGVRYRPVSARYKVYIIDEVHMLSTSAFTALLKTLEEPPPHVKFVFATTEVRKVPLTVLSRCQRFDLRRIEVVPLAQHLGAIASTEGVAVEPTALTLIARAAEGSVRDALSLFDQAIAHADGAVTESAVRDLFGLGQLAQGLDLLDRVFGGDIAGALRRLRDQYAAGSDPLAVLQDLLGLTHWLTRCKLAPDDDDDAALTADERRRGREMAARLGMAALARAWQMLLKGLNEARLAPEPLAASEMVLVRLAYAAELPSTAELVRSLSGAAPAAPPAAPASGSGGAPPPTPAAPAAPSTEASLPGSLAELAALAEARREFRLYATLTNDVHGVSFAPGHIVLRARPAAPGNLARILGEHLAQWTGRPWTVELSAAEGEPTLAERNTGAERERRTAAAQDPLVRSVLETFPGAEISEIRERAPLPLPDAEPHIDTEHS